jgi:uncharacterized membrane protein YjfL (UPF0719 family)
VAYFDYFAAVTYFILDIAALFSVIGSAIIAIGGIISTRSGRRFRAPNQIYTWSVGGLILGIVGLISSAISDQITMEKTPLFGYSMTTIGLLLFFSVLLLMVGKVLQGKVRQTAFAKSRRYGKQTR